MTDASARGEKPARHSGAYFLTSRIAFAAFLLLTSFYALLAFIPYTYFAFIQTPFDPFLPRFARYHAFIFWPLFVPVAVDLWQRYSRTRFRSLALLFVAMGSAAGIYLLVASPLRHLQNDLTSYLLALDALFVIAWLATIDCLAVLPDVEWPPERHTRVSISFAVSAALLISLTQTLVALWRYFHANPTLFPGRKDLLISAWSVLLHLLLFLAVAAFLSLGESLAQLMPRPAAAGFLFRCLLATAAAAVLFRKIIFTSLAFNGWQADVYALVAGAVVVSAFYGLRLQRGLPAPSAGSDARFPLLSWLPIAALLAGLAYYVPTLIGGMDWNFILQKLWALAFWSLVLGLLLRATPRAVTAVPASLWRSALLLAVCIAGYKGAAWTQHYWPVWAQESNLDVRNELERYASFDPSFRVAREFWSYAEPDLCDDYCRFLIANSGIAESAPASPHDVNLVADLKPAAGLRPNIFIFVVDSLRRDYVSAYNPKVTFTPEMGKFAAESVVMQNTFTRYGGTTLSEPAIWAGAMLLHKHYVLPFQPMNSMQKLTQTDGYQSFVSVDTVLNNILKPLPPDLVQVDKDVKKWDEYDMCSTVPDLEAQIAAHSDGRPIYFFAQPANIHIVALRMHAALHPAKHSYPGFAMQHASEIERLDGCFGRFIEYLKQNKLYDNSIVVVTADHGDSMGENGYLGHSYELHPEIVRIPLIIHLPPKLREGLYIDEKQVAFTIDIAPTIYYLLGHRPIVPNVLYGKPLFTQTKAELEQYKRPDWLLASSYGPAYGLLEGDGSALFISDEVRHTDHFYTFDHNYVPTKHLVTDELRKRYQPLIRQHIQEIADFYHFKPEAGASPAERPR